MSRKSRIDAPGVLHHVMTRGIERRNIFKDNRDRNDFLKRLSKIVIASKTICYAWSLLPNHFHLRRMKKIIKLKGPVPIILKIRSGMRASAWRWRKGWACRRQRLRFSQASIDYRSSPAMTAAGTRSDVWFAFTRKTSAKHSGFSLNRNTKVKAVLL